jgi:hypothetical protein
MYFQQRRCTFSIRGSVSDGDVLYKVHRHIHFLITDTARPQGGRKAEGVGVVKDKELKREEIEVSLTLGGAGEGRVQADIEASYTSSLRPQTPVA